MGCNGGMCRLVGVHPLWCTWWLCQRFGVFQVFFNFLALFTFVVMDDCDGGLGVDSLFLPLLGCEILTVLVYGEFCCFGFWCGEFFGSCFRE